MNRIDWKPIILAGGGGGALVGLWTGGWITGFLILWTRGFLHAGVDIPAPHSEHLRVSAEEALGMFEEAVHLDLPGGLWLLLVWIVAIAAVAGATMAAVGRLTSLDPKGIAYRSFTWALRSIASWPSLALCCGLLASSFLSLWAESTLLYVAAAVVNLGLALFLIPISVCHHKVAARDTRATDWWKPKWPGWAAVGFFLGIEVLDGVLSYLHGLVPLGLLAAVVLATLAWLLLSTIAGLAQAWVLFTASLFKALRRPPVFHWAVLGPWFALHFWMLLIPCCLAGPILVGYVWNWKFVPVLATLCESLDMRLPFSYQILINAMRLIGRDAGVLFIVPISLFYWFGAARFVFQATLTTSTSPKTGRN